MPSCTMSVLVVTTQIEISSSVCMYKCDVDKQDLAEYTLQLRSSWFSKAKELNFNQIQM